MFENRNQGKTFPIVPFMLYDKMAALPMILVVLAVMVLAGCAGKGNVLQKETVTINLFDYLKKRNNVQQDSVIDYRSGAVQNYAMGTRRHPTIGTHHGILWLHCGTGIVRKQRPCHCSPKHARGQAIDINTLYNPYYKDRDDGTRFIQPATAAGYCDRTWDFPYKIDHDDLCFRLFTEAGFEWGSINRRIICM